MKDLQSLLPVVQCPQCRGGELSVEDDSRELFCKVFEARYPVTHGRPVLLRPDNAVFRLDDYRRAGLPPPEVLVQGWGRFIPALGAGNTVRVVYSDIDVGADVDLFCDGHDLPFAGGVFDAVVMTAVLEHVLYPERVAAEIHRVLKVGGLLYSELPFMQQVHEGAYDFTCYTPSGHWRLFNHFSEIDSGLVAGPGTALVWAMENFPLVFFVENRLRLVVKTLVRLSFFWIKVFDYLFVRKPQAMDGASRTYILAGSKTSLFRIKRLSSGI